MTGFCLRQSFFDNLPNDRIIDATQTAGAVFAVLLLLLFFEDAEGFAGGNLYQILKK
jgi:hypothetical protein